MKSARDCASSVARPWRVVYVEGTTEMGGAEHVLLNLLQRLPRHRVEPLLVCPGEGELSRQTRSIGVRCQPLAMPPFWSTSRIWRERLLFDPIAIGYNAAAVVVAAKRLTSVLRDDPPDLIHTNSMMAHFYGAIAARCLGVPCVWHLHDLVDGRRLGGLMGLFWRSLAARLPTWVVGASRYCLQVFGTSDKADFIYAGVDGHLGEPETPTNASWRSMLGLESEAVLVGYVGRIGWFKGLEVLVRAADLVRKQESAAHFVLIGAPLFGETEYQRQLIKFIQQLDLQSHVHLAGYYPDAAQRLSDFRCLVLPSLRETFPVVLLEAGLAGQPVVATRVGGVPEIVVDGETGLLVPANDARTLADALLRLIRNPELATRLGERAKRHVTEHFNIQTTVERWIALYERILAKSFACI